jgi:hypothetical protein
MTEPFVRSLDALGQWRLALSAQLRDLARELREQDMLDETIGDQLDGLRDRLASEKLVVAFVAEFSRGKSELINAIFFSDAGRRIMPASPGRTTMCPVELGWDADEPPGLALLPIETRLEGASLAELRAQRKAWTREALNLDDPEKFAQSLTAVMRTRSASLDEARALGFWSDEHPQDNPPQDADGRVDVPAWRHAVINVPHPLLKRGLVVLDTPGLNAIGAEPELTVSLLPTAHATVFILGADTGVTKSDLAIWRDHLSAQALSRYVALNKIDSLVDPLSPAAQVEAHIAQQVKQVASTLQIDAARVFPISARQALAARVAGDAPELERSRLPALESALADQLLPQRREVLRDVALESMRQVEHQVGRHLADARRQLAEQLIELRGLRGKSATKVDLMLKRVSAEATEFEQCVTQLQAMRSVHARMLKNMLVGLSADRLREQLSAMQEEIRDSVLKLGAKRAFAKMCTELRSMLQHAAQRNQEIHDMLGAAYVKLNTQFGYTLANTELPDMVRYESDLALIERNYVQYLGLGQAMRLAQPRFMEQFRRMLLSRLRVVFESASSELELWNKTASAQVDTQLRERRRAFKRRRESLEKIQIAAGELDARLGELDAHDERLASIEKRIGELIAGVRSAAQDTDLQSAMHAGSMWPTATPRAFAPTSPLDTQPMQPSTADDGHSVDILLLDLPDVLPPDTRSDATGLISAEEPTTTRPGLYRAA